MYFELADRIMIAGKGFVSEKIMYVTESPVSHIDLITREGDEEQAQVSGFVCTGGRTIDLIHYFSLRDKGKISEIYVKKLKPEYKKFAWDIATYMEWLTKTNQRYDYGAVLGIYYRYLIKKFLGTGAGNWVDNYSIISKWLDRHRDDFYCAEGVAEADSQCGLSIEDDPYKAKHLTPHDFYKNDDYTLPVQLIK